MIKQRKSELFLQLFLEAFPTNQELPHRSYKESLVLQTTMKMIHWYYHRLFSDWKRTGNYIK